MITKTYNPLDAKWWFKYGTYINFAGVLIGFVVLVFILQNLMPPVVADLIAVGLAYAVFFYVLGKRTIAVECPHCNGYIETNTPWKCGNPKCQKDNEQVDDFPFIYRCQHCGVEQKAFECPHPKCGQPIYLTQEKLKTIYATIVKMPKQAEPKPFKKDPIADKISQENEALRQTEYELRKARLDVQLKAVKKELEPEKDLTQEEILSKSAKEFVDRNMSGAKIVEQLKAKNAKLFKNNPAELEKQNLLVDMWAKNHLDDM